MKQSKWAAVHKTAAIGIMAALLLLAAGCGAKNEDWPQDIDPVAIAAEIGTVDLYGYTIADAPTNAFAIVMSPSAALPAGGAFVVEMDGKAAPRTVAHISTLVGAGFYNHLTFHRIVRNFVIQAGSPAGDGTGGSGQTIKGEFAANGVKNTLQHKKYVVSMGRLDGTDKEAYNSADSQFFICLSDQSSVLDGRYAAFAKVVAGTAVVDALGMAETAGSANRPLEAQVIVRAFFVNRPAG